MYRRSITLKKVSQRRVDPDKLRMQVAGVVGRIEASNRKERGWTASSVGNYARPVEENGFFRYNVDMAITCVPKRARDQASLDAEFEKIRTKVIEPACNKHKWVVAALDGEQTEAARLGVGQPMVDAPMGYFPVNIPQNHDSFFSHIYDRNEQIHVVLSAIKASITSDWRNRFHTVLWGKPACGKTEIFMAVRKMLGDDAVLMFDATNTTQAGAIKDLTERSVLPRIMIVEEIEKADENSLRWMLSVLDQRAEIRKVTYRRSIQRDMQLLTFATVNNHELFRRLMSGALFSRFANHLYCPRPDTMILRKILNREINQVQTGDSRWIEPTLEYAQRHNIYDPREVKSICLCGGDDLLTGKYQLILDKLRKNEELDNKAN